MEKGTSDHVLIAKYPASCRPRLRQAAGADARREAAAGLEQACPRVLVAWFAERGGCSEEPLAYFGRSDSRLAHQRGQENLPCALQGSYTSGMWVQGGQALFLAVERGRSRRRAMAGPGEAEVTREPSVGRAGNTGAVNSGLEARIFKIVLSRSWCSGQRLSLRPGGAESGLP